MFAGQEATVRTGHGTTDWLQIEKEREFQNNIYFCFIDYAKALTVWIITSYGKFFKRWEYQTT